MLKEKIKAFLDGLPYDELDKIDGLHWFCVDYHEGQSSHLYALQCELGYKPSILHHKPATKAARKIYKLLAETF